MSKKSTYLEIASVIPFEFVALAMGFSYGDRIVGVGSSTFVPVTIISFLACAIKHFFLIYSFLTLPGACAEPSLPGGAPVCVATDKHAQCHCAPRLPCEFIAANDCLFDCN
jgi:hypothetical protein